ncbi:hypothetical protein [Leptolyngbya iicbica]|uniref:Uncharacterized protein n=2 Tax=Cyanophyceae TaxID=3028117 RepID=A0A4Q7EHT3_9CYAN|nr:hypothetical protein [Leptolyngbya sp. LK]RZM82935.1 hypothetical protein DYY88_06985 [Leptolyngbya sp. LK]
MSDSLAEKIACLEVLAAVANLNGDPTPLEFEAFLAAINSFQPLPAGVTPEKLLSTSADIAQQLSQIQAPELQQQVYRGAFAIARSKGIDPQEAKVLGEMKTAFALSPEMAQALEKQPLIHASSDNFADSALSGMASLIGREGEIRRMIFDYAMGAAIVGLVPLTGGGTLEIKLVIVLALILKMTWDIRQRWGQPQGQGMLVTMGSAFGILWAGVAGLIVWGIMIGLGVVVPYADAFAKAAGFATATWLVGQAVNQFYASPKRPDFSALKRAFPNLISTDKSTS